jgi:hypothetical protein
MTNSNSRTASFTQVPGVEALRGDQSSLEPRFRFWVNAETRLRWEPRFDPPSKALIIEKVQSGVDSLITTLRDSIDAEVFDAEKLSPKSVAQIEVCFDNINRAEYSKTRKCQGRQGT